MSATIITDLPPELLSTLFSFLDGKYLSPVAQTCKLFRYTLQIDSIWRQRCLAEYNVHHVDTEVVSWKDAYTHLLFHCGYMLGLWKAVITHYGGLLHVKFTGTKIEATEYLSPPNHDADKPLRARPLFTIELDSMNHRMSICHRGYQDARHPVDIKKCGDDDDGQHMMFRYLCHRKDYHAQQADPNGPQSVFLEWLRVETGNPNLNAGLEDIQGNELILMKFMVLLQFECDMQFLRLKIPNRPLYPVPIEAGLFKGTYGSHGVEIILLEYSDDKHAIGTKITGDPNVPAGKLSLKADLSRTMILSAKQQTTVRLLKDIDTADIPPDVNINNIPRQPFVMPSDCYECRDISPKSTCTYRCHSQGQIAGHGFTSARLTPGHWIVFDENTFAHLWMELSSLSVYSRVTEDILS